ncbi:MAG: potassium channel family protein [Pseudomonadales bacterium]|nr:potassium channel family protein [Pseudomonadales bacterium]
MNTVIFLILRQMRVPLLLLSAVYAVATWGMTVIPGVDDQGNIYYMDYFHAFYFISFMGTTIGFGEIPYEFSDAQRMWALIFIYITVATWIYTIGALINLLQNETLKRAFTEYQFRQQVSQIMDGFYLICGYGDTGSQLVRALRSTLTQASVIDISQERMDALVLEEHPMTVPGICANARDPHNLMLAGINHPSCECVVALTDDNAVNLHVAISAKVMNPSLKVICRADNLEVEANMASFGTDYIVDPFETFARNFAMATHAPHQYQLQEWFRRESGHELTDVQQIPKGYWILCGFGRFGQALHRQMTAQGMEVRVIEPDRTRSGLPKDTIYGYGTEAHTLIEADIKRAVGIIAGANDDSNNLSIIVTAREINPDLFQVVRQTEHANRALFRHCGAHIVMESSDVLATKIRTLLTCPMTDEFLSLARAHEDAWALGIIEQIRRISPDRMPEIWEVAITPDTAAAVSDALAAGTEVRLEHLTHDHTDRDVGLGLIPLLHTNEKGAFCLPSQHTVLAPGDRLLFTGVYWARWKMQWNLQNAVALHYVMTGESLPRTWFGRLLARRRQEAEAAL